MATRGRPRAFDRDTALQRAMDVFWVRGYEGASLAALTEAMEIRPPSLYAAFGSKEGLFREALAHYLGQHGRYRRDVLDGAPSAREGVAERSARPSRASVPTSSRAVAWWCSRR